MQKRQLYAGLVIGVLGVAFLFSVLNTRGDTEVPIYVKNEVPVSEISTDTKVLTETAAVTVVTYNEQEQKLITTTITNPVTTTIQGETSWVTVQAPYFRVTISGWGRLLSEAGEVIESQYLRSTIEEARAIEDWQIEVRIRIQSNIADWDTGKIKLKVFIQDRTTLEIARIVSETDLPPYRGLNPTGDTVEFLDDWRGSVRDAVDELGGTYEAPRPFRFIFAVQCYQFRDIRTGEFIHDSGLIDEVITEVGFRTILHYSEVASEMIVDAPVNEEDTTGGKGKCLICDSG